MPNTEHTEWKTYCQTELDALTPILLSHGYTLLQEQPHLKGERFLQQAVTTTSGKKLILLGTDSDNSRVVIKATSDSEGKAELERERKCRRVLAEINFAGEVFHTPEEIDFIHERDYTISIQRFIAQESPFLERPIEEQFTLALTAFKAQESAHATTYQHKKRIQRTYHIRDARAYIEAFSAFSRNIKSALPTLTDLHNTLTEARTFLEEEKIIIDQYGGFLTHTDFVPHNFRIKDNTIYLLDHSSLTFGNKYEGWARFLNFMTLYNQPLERAFVQYISDNRTPEESRALQLMRVYRLGEIIWYYTNTLKESKGDLHTLNTARVDFWATVLTYVLKNEPVPAEIITTYQHTRDSLRSEEEKERQKGLH